MSQAHEGVGTVWPIRRAGTFLIGGQVVLIGAYVLFIVVPYFVNGLHNEPAAQVEGGWFDPKGLWPYDTAIGPVLVMAMAMTIAMSWVFAALISISGVVLAAGGAWLATAERIAALAATAMGVAFVLFLFSDTGGHLAAWALD
jgi:hypothetical protein